MTKNLIALLIVLLGFSFPAAAQTISNDFSLELTILNEDKIQTLYLSDLDFQNFGTAEEIFQLTITKLTDQSYPNCFFEIRLFKDNEKLVEAISRPFTIPASFKSDVISNLTLASGSYKFGEGDDTEVHFDQTNIQPEAEDLQKEILASGKAPSGVYLLTIELRQVNQSMPLAKEEKILLKATNPSYLNPVSPGAPVGSSQVPAIFSQYPLFQWTGNGTEYQVMVFEKKDMMESFDDIINSQPNWVSERTSQFSLQYPQSGGAIPLEYNKTYYWLVRMYIYTSSGEEFLDSEIWQFKLVNPERSSNLQDQLAQNELWQFLEQLLGSSASEVKENLKDASLKRIFYNGEEITLDQFFNILNSYRGKQFELLEFEASEQ